LASYDMVLTTCCAKRMDKHTVEYIESVQGMLACNQHLLS